MSTIEAIRTPSAQAGAASLIIRRQRAETMARIRHGELGLLDVLNEQPPCLRRIPLYRLLDELPHFGPRKIAALNRLAMRADVNLAITVGELSPLKRAWLAEHICEVSPRTANLLVISRRPQG